MIRSSALAASVVLLAGSTGACGATRRPAESAVTQEREGTARLAGTAVSSRHTAALASFESGAAIVVDGAAGPAGARRVVATWIEDGLTRTAEDRDRPPLVYPEAWTDGVDLYVFGVECAEVALELVADIDSYAPEEVCGTPELRRVVRRLDSTTGAWSEAGEPPGADVGGSALLVGVGATALTKAADGSTSSLDLTTGEAASLPEVSLADATLARACPLDDGSVLVVAMTAPIPGTPGLETPPEPFALWSVRGSEAVTLPVPDGLHPETYGPVECLPGRGVLGSASQGTIHAVLVDPSDGLRVERVEVPGGGAEAATVTIHSSGRDLLLWVSEDEAVVPWALGPDGEWMRAGGAHPSLGPPAQSVVCDEGVLGLVTTYGATGEDGEPVESSVVTRI